VNGADGDGGSLTILCTDAAHHARLAAFGAWLVTCARRVLAARRLFDARLPESRLEGAGVRGAAAEASRQRRRRPGQRQRDRRRRLAHHGVIGILIADHQRLQQPRLAARRDQPVVGHAEQRRDHRADPGRRPRLVDHRTQFVATAAERMRRAARHHQRVAGARLALDTVDDEGETSLHDLEVLVIAGVAVRRRPDVARREYADAPRLHAAACGAVAEAEDPFAGDRL
jgi:hypothetical protein